MYYIDGIQFIVFMFLMALMGQLQARDYRGNDIYNMHGSKDEIQ